MEMTVGRLAKSLLTAMDEQRWADMVELARLGERHFPAVTSANWSATAEYAEQRLEDQRSAQVFTAWMDRLDAADAARMA